MKSRPIYPGLNPHLPARSHILAAEGEGARALIEFAEAGPAPAARSTVVYTAAASAPHGYSLRLQSAGFDVVHVLPTVPTLLARLKGLLMTEKMGMRLQVAGREGFIGLVVALGNDHRVDPDSIITEHRGSLARRVQCVHCKGFTEDVTLSVFPCSHCGLPLFVRDHYSRRLGAFAGVNVNAEVPSESVPSQEIYR